MKRYSVAILIVTGLALVCFAQTKQTKVIPKPRAIPGDTVFVGHLRVRLVVPDSCVVYYTLDGSIPSAHSGTFYTNGFTITIDKPTRLSAVARSKNFRDSLLSSEVITASYQQRLSMPYVANYRPFFKDSIDIILAQPQDGRMFYTIDGSTPDQNSLAYVSPIVLRKSTKLKVMATKPGYVDSGVRLWQFSKRPQ